MAGKHSGRQISGLQTDLGGTHAVQWLLVLRALEGVGFLLTVMPGPGLIRALTPPGADKAALGLWGAYMPLGVALALLLGPALIAWGGWPDWWWALSVVSAGAALWLWVAVPADRLRPTATGPASGGWSSRLRATVGARAPWLVALTFAVYSSQWMAVIGFLPAIYAGAGVPAAVRAFAEGLLLLEPGRRDDQAAMMMMARFAVAWLYALEARPRLATRDRRWESA